MTVTWNRKDSRSMDNIVLDSTMSRDELIALLDDLPPCRDCGKGMLFSVRDIGDGLCHDCSHRRYAKIRRMGRNWWHFYADLIVFVVVGIIVFPLYAFRPNDYLKDSRAAWEEMKELWLK